MAKNEFTSQDVTNQAAARAHFAAYSAALAAGKSTAEAMQAAEAARRVVNTGTR